MIEITCDLCGEKYQIEVEDLDADPACPFCGEPWIVEEDE